MKHEYSIKWYPHIHSSGKSIRSLSQMRCDNLSIIDEFQSLYLEKSSWCTKRDTNRPFLVEVLLIALPALKTWNVLMVHDIFFKSAPEANIKQNSYFEMIFKHTSFDTRPFDPLMTRMIFQLNIIPIEIWIQNRRIKSSI